MKKRFGLILSTLLVGQALMIGVAGADTEANKVVEGGFDLATIDLLEDHFESIPNVKVKVQPGKNNNSPDKLEASIIRAAKVYKNTGERGSLILFEDSTGRDLFVVDPPSAIP